MPILSGARLAEEIARSREEAQLTREAMRRHEIVLTNLVNITSDLHDASRAHTDAVFKMIDTIEERLPPRDGPGS